MTIRSNLIAKAVKMALLATASASLALTATVNAAEEQEEEAEEEKVEKVTIVGSRIKRTDVEGAQPVTVITTEDMAKQGHVTVFDALTNLTQNSSFQFEGPEFSSGFTPDVQTLNLRGFGVGNTLMLLNGRRISSYPAAYQSDTSVFNFGAIPAAAVKEIRVLSTGASAIYGSDAVAGVVDIILKDSVDETTINLIVGTPTESDSNPLDTQFKLVTGKSFDNGNVTLAYQYTDRELIKAGEFDDYDSDLDYPYGDGVLTRYVLDLNRWAPFRGELGYQDPGAGTCEAMGNGTVRSFRPNSGYFCGSDDAAETTFRNQKESHSIFLHGDYQLSDDVQLFADILYYQSESANNSRYLFVSEEILDTTNIVDTGVIGNYYDWFVAQRLFTEEELGRNLDTTFEDDSLNVSVGATGFWGEHEWEVSLNRSDYEYTSKNPWWKAEDVISLFLGDYYGTSFYGTDWWSGTGPLGLRDNLFTPLDDTTRALVNDAIGNHTYGNETSSTSAQFNISGDWFDNWQGTVQYAAVLEYEKQDFKFVPDERISQDPPLPNLPGSGWWKLTGYQGEGDRSRVAVGGELLIPMHDTLNINLAARVDKYDSDSSSIGTRTTPSISFEWRPIEDLLIRGGYSESFRAPDLNQVYTTTGFFTGTTDLVQCLQEYEFINGSSAGFDPSSCTSSSSFVRRVGSQELGGEPLKDETGYSAWFGFSAELAENLTLMATLNRVNLEDRVQTESASQLLRQEYECYTNSGEVSQSRCDYIDARIDRETDPNTGISYVSRFNVSPLNVSEQEIDSLDANLRWGHPFDAGYLAFDVDYSHMLSNKYRASDTSEEIDLRDDEISGGWDPRSRVTTTLSWSGDDYRLALTAFRRGGVTAWRPSQRDPDSDYRMRPYITYNFTANYNWTEDFSTGLRVRNLFNAKPPKDETFLFYDYPWYNHFVYAGAGIGRELYLEATYTF
ncbi:hypothetical protein CW740_05370 [Kangiella profundi]|uniref:Uncharacterized protein n=1 Tax=Kangiella profundi TaxID=1561924 RepID=A0A2K9B1C5_9GAMM|nr:TonB-dependent receptor [Kangiella profundi]AUD78708.1 hypothetical protein CW740_05370 [Kangiella profundi]GGE90121.1 TonB-dependent receptor [Kangiella profundi]